MSQKRTGRALVAILAASVLVATACGQGTTPSQTSTPSGGAGATATAAIQQGGRVIEATISDIATMQPILSNDTASGRITALLYEGLIDVDEKTGEPKNGLATFSTSSDGKTFTFEINAKANWSDGKPIVAEDYLTGMKAVAKSGKSVRKSNFEEVAGYTDFQDGKADTISGVKIDASNPKKFTVTMATISCAAILDVGVNGYILPTQVFGKYVTAGSKPEDIDTAPENTDPKVVSGPFTFSEWRKGDQVILKKNTTYWRGAPHLDEYVYKVVASTDAITAGLKTGEITFGTIQPTDLADMQTVDTVQITKYPLLGYTYIGWDLNSTNSPGLADKRVRQALAYGLDMSSVIQAVLLGEGTAHVAHHVPVQWPYPANASSLNQYAFDQTKANQLLDDAGWTKGSDGMRAKDGKKFTLTISTNSGNKVRETLAQVAADQYKQLGIDAKAAPEAFQGLVTKLTAGDTSLDAVIIGWSLGVNPDPYSIWHSSQVPDPATNKTGFGFTYFKSAEMDKAIEEARTPANGDCSTATRKKHYETFNKILNEEQPYNFGFVPNTLAVSQKTLQSFAPTSFSTIYNVQDWWVKQ